MTTHEAISRLANGIDPTTAGGFEEIKQDKSAAYGGLQRKLPKFFKGLGIHPPEIAIYDRLLNEDVSTVHESSIKSSAYVLHTLEASIWCLLTTDSYQEAVLKTVNPGGDTDQPDL